MYTATLTDLADSLNRMPATSSGGEVQAVLDIHDRSGHQIIRLALTPAIVAELDRAALRANAAARCCECGRIDDGLEPGLEYNYECEECTERAE